MIFVHFIKIYDYWKTLKLVLFVVARWRMDAQRCEMPNNNTDVMMDNLPSTKGVPIVPSISQP